MCVCWGGGGVASDNMKERNVSAVEGEEESE